MRKYSESGRIEKMNLTYGETIRPKMAHLLPETGLLVPPAIVCSLACKFQRYLLQKLQN